MAELITSTFDKLNWSDYVKLFYWRSPPSAML